MSGDKGRAGRKVHREGGKLAAVIACRLTASENAAYKSQVEAAGMSSGEYLRKLIVERPVQIVARPRISADKAKLVYLTAKAGNNLNQIARSLNTAKATGQVTSRVYERTLSELISLGAYLRGQIDRVD